MVTAPCDRVFREGHCGILPTCSLSGILERQGLCNVRFHHKGSRELLVFSAGSFFQQATSHHITLDTKADLVESIKIFVSAMSEATCKQWLDDGFRMVHCNVGEGDLLYIPFGHLLCERVLKSDNVIGVRTMALNDNGLESFKILVNEYCSHPASQPALKQFWNRTLSVFEKPSVPPPVLSASIPAENAPGAATESAHAASDAAAVEQARSSEIAAAAAGAVAESAPDVANAMPSSPPPAAKKSPSLCVPASASARSEVSDRARLNGSKPKAPPRRKSKEDEELDEVVAKHGFS